MKKLFLSLCIPLLICFAAGCGDDPVDSGGGFDYDLTSPAGLGAAFSAAWERRDFAGWADMLYDGAEDTGADWPLREFEFYFLNYGSPNIPALSWTLANELSSVGAIFAGEAGETYDGVPIPGVRSVELTLMLTSDWSPWSGGTVMGDPCPSGTLRALFDTDILFMLTGNIGDSDIDSFQVLGRAEFYVVPVTVGGETEYRLWKWVDLVASERPEGAEFADRATETINLGFLKSVYGTYTPPAYDLSSHDDLTEAFVHAWNDMNFAAYLDLLYCGQEHEGDHLPFEFYFIDPDAPGIPGESWLYDDDLASAEGMFGGAAGEDHEGAPIQSIESIELMLSATIPWSMWNDGEAGEVLGDPCPAGTMSALFDTGVLFDLSGDIGGGDINSFMVNGRAQLFAIPIMVNGTREYRLWKWVDMWARADRATGADRASEEISFGQIKVLY